MCCVSLWPPQLFYTKHTAWLTALMSAADSAKHWEKELAQTTWEGSAYKCLSSLSPVLLSFLHTLQGCGMVALSHNWCGSDVDLLILPRSFQPEMTLGDDTDPTTPWQPHNTLIRTTLATSAWSCPNKLSLQIPLATTPMTQNALLISKRQR